LLFSTVIRRHLGYRRRFAFVIGDWEVFATTKLIQPPRTGGSHWATGRMCAAQASE